jgi:hypothetical protein
MAGAVMWQRFLLGAVTFVGCAAIGIVAQMLPARGGSDPRDAFSGTWTLDRGLSEAAPGPGGLAGEGGPSGWRRGPGGMGGRGPGRPGGGMARGRSRATEEEAARRRALLRELMEPPERLTIVVGSNEVTFTDGSGRSWRLATDGRKEKHQLDHGTVTTRTRWEGETLVRTIEAGNGFEVTETYRVEPGEARRLQVTVKIGGGRMGSSRTLTRTYDAAAEGNPDDPRPAVGLA